LSLIIETSPPLHIFGLF